jgi:rare lipoprotein A
MTSESRSLVHDPPSDVWLSRSLDLHVPKPSHHAALFLLPLLFLNAGLLPLSRAEVPSAPVAQVLVSQTGIASWYGPGFHGKPTASTVIYNQYELTAAHPTLPFGSRVLVTNLENGNSTEVIITDRGPFAKGRIIDLSFAAGKLIDMIVPGTATVRLDVIDSGPHEIQSVPTYVGYTLQLGAFSRLENAEHLRENLSTSLPGVVIVPLPAKDARYYRVQMGTFVNRRSAEERAHQLSQSGVPAIIMER